MTNNLRFNIAEQRLIYSGQTKEFVFERDRVIEFNHRHRSVLANYDLPLRDELEFERLLR